MPVYALNTEFPGFPDPRRSDKSGLLAIGGKLDPEWLYIAYSLGVFPWFNSDDPIMWWSPDPRAVIYPGQVNISKSMKTLLRKEVFSLKIDTAFEEVIDRCKLILRRDQDDTWITEDVKTAYIQMHTLGFAHSFETWQGDELVGGLYGVSIGKMFFGESMFSDVSNASKFAFIQLSEILKANSFTLIDCQIPNPHLARMGCFEMKRKDYLRILYANDPRTTIAGDWGEILNF